MTGKRALEEGLQEGGEGYLAAQAGSLARGDKGVLNSEDWSNVGQQAAQGVKGDFNALNAINRIKIPFHALV